MHIYSYIILSIRSADVVFLEFFIYSNIITLISTVEYTWIDNANYFQLIPQLLILVLVSSFPWNCSSALCKRQGEKKKRKRKKYTRAWKQFYSGVSGRDASRNQKLRFFLTMFLAYLCRCAEIALPRQNIFRWSGIQFFCRRCPFSPNYRTSSFPSWNVERFAIRRRCRIERGIMHLCFSHNKCLIGNFSILILIFMSSTKITQPKTSI